jgi:tetratricopeptide (TPR) repeat protein
VIYAAKGEHAKAETILRKVLEVSPNYSLARNNLAVALSRQGKTAEADAMLETVGRLSGDSGGYPQTPDGLKNLARLRHKEGKDAEAFQILEKALQEFPGNWALVRLQAEIVREADGPAKALPIVQNFVHQHWWHAAASISLAGLFLETDQSSQATAALRHASRLDVHDVEALNLMAMISVRENRLEDAFEIQRRAVARQPNEPRQYLILSDILQKMGRTDEARAALAQVNAANALPN